MRRVRFLSLITLSREKVRSSFPFEAGRERRSLARVRTFDHSAEVDA